MHESKKAISLTVWKYELIVVSSEEVCVLNIGFERSGQAKRERKKKGGGGGIGRHTVVWSEILRYKIFLEKALENARKGDGKSRLVFFFSVTVICALDSKADSPCVCSWHSAGFPHSRSLQNDQNPLGQWNYFFFFLKDHTLAFGQEEFLIGEKTVLSRSSKWLIWQSLLALLIFNIFNNKLVFKDTVDRTSYGQGAVGVGALFRFQASGEFRGHGPKELLWCTGRLFSPGARPLLLTLFLL